MTVYKNIFLASLFIFLILIFFSLKISTLQKDFDLWSIG